MFYIDVVNKVLRRLREDEVSTVYETSYSKVISLFVNDAREEVENAWDWTVLRSEITITTSAGTAKYSLGKDAGYDLERMRILGAYNTTSKYTMRRVSTDHMKRLTLLATSQSASPVYYTIGGQSMHLAGNMTASDGIREVYPYLTLYPTPDATETLIFNLVKPDTELQLDSDIMKVPWRPVYLKAYLLALADRGEDDTSMYARAEQQYNQILGDNIAIDALRVDEELQWEAT